jgi:hypothetical protein
MPTPTALGRLAATASFALAPNGLHAQQTWTALHTMPLPNGEVHLCAQRADHRILCLSGRSTDPDLETWEWGGSSWHRRRPTHAPPWRQGPAVAYDSARAVVVVFGGGGAGFTWLADTWEWDGAEWHQRSPATSPPARYHAGLAYDLRRQRAVLYGGADGSGRRSDLWEWNGTTWQQRMPGGSLPPAAYPMLAYNEARGRTVLCPHDLTAPTLEVYEYDGNRWTHAQPAWRPPGTNGARIAYDPHRARTVLFSGSTGFLPTTQHTDVLEWDGVQWQRVVSPAPPPYRVGTGFAYDARARRFVLHGGGPIVDTWTYDATTAVWTRMPQRAPFDVRAATQDLNGHALVLDLRGTFLWHRDTLAFEHLPAQPAPQVTGHTGLAFDDLRGEAMLLGATTAGSETWRWRAAVRQWQRVPGVSPPHAHGAAMAYDRLRGTAVVFGGVLDWTGQPTYVADTWLWDGSGWTLASPPADPGARVSAAMAWDPTTGNVVLFGGRDRHHAFLDDTREWNGSTWTQRATSPGPTGRWTHALTTRANGVGLVGGDANGALRDAWLLQGSTWLAETVTGLPQFAQVVASSDPLRDEVVVFGGANPYAYPTAGVWLLAEPPATVTPFGGGCGAGGATTLAADAPPVLGSVVHVQAGGFATLQPAAFVLGFTAQRTDLAPGCRLFVAPQATAFAATDAAGAASLAVPLPTAATFVGIEVHAQAAALDPATGFALTPATTLRLGR